MSNLTQDDALVTAPSDYVTADPGPPACPLRLPPVKEVLSNYTLLTRIFSNIIPLDDRDADQATIAEERKRLLAIARVSTAFRDPALDRLWKCLGSLVPLILLIGCVRLVDGVYTISDIHIHGDQLQPSFFKYAERVRTLEISERMAIVSNDAPIDPNIYFLLSQHLGGTPLLPRLESIVLSSPTISSSTTLPLLMLLPCSSLSAVEVQGPILETAWCHRVFLPALASRASSSLKHLALKHDKEGFSGKGLWDRNILENFRELQTLSLYSPKSHSSNVMPGGLFNRLTHLRNLTLYLRSLHTAFGTSKPLNLSSLQHLSLLEEVSNPWQGSRASEFLVPSVARSLVSLTITFYQAGEWSTLGGLNKGLRACKTLKRLTLQSRHQGTWISGTKLLDFLAGFRIDDLVVNVEGLEAADNFFDRLLVLPSKWTGHTPDLASLTRIAPKAQKLQRLGIPIQSDLNPPVLKHVSSLISSESGPLGSQRSDLLHLELCDIRDPEKPSHISPHQYQIIAQYIDKLFPRLVSINLHPNSKCKDFWLSIEQLRLMYKEMRLKLSSCLARGTSH
ncbi:hypothetical protein EST38_g13897 [Candolleomyces aberdarensis]|uniref:Uncharacterized protein n=1 Tax=Candolleomyces aberdarensis TaxID=2316362 RepID=A0A4V1Q1L0_9AGAR|nr:hypothetical protein EST38_g13897 [Candolleomyces aberdarensis]